MRVGVFGATGQVGNVMRALLEQRGFPVEEMRYFASARSAGSTLPWRDTEVTVEDTVTVHYTGVTWSDGSTFDSSWERGAPTTFPLSGVIAGWSEGLEGQKVGSRVLISIPSEQAYGEQGTPTGDLKNEDLLFVVDILDAQAPAPQN